VAPDGQKLPPTLAPIRTLVSSTCGHIDHEFSTLRDPCAVLWRIYVIQPQPSRQPTAGDLTVATANIYLSDYLSRFSDERPVAQEQIQSVPIFSASTVPCQRNPRCTLEPSCTATVGLWTAPGGIPIATRKFGRFPDTNRWQIGDLVLFSQFEPDYGSRAIRFAQQNLGFIPDDARWNHAAVYMDNDFICDATPFWGVRYRKIYDYIGHYALRVRRDPLLSDKERTQIAIQAASHLRNPYCLRELGRIGAQSLRRLLLPQFVDAWPNNSGLICSTLYANAYYRATSKTLQNPASGEPVETVTPAFLSYTRRLVDVECAWLSIS
jgi:hypothetical protein